MLHALNLEALSSLARRGRPRGIRAQFAVATALVVILFGTILICLLQARSESREAAIAQQALGATAHRIVDRLSSDLLARQHELVLIADLLDVDAQAHDQSRLRRTLDDLARRESTYAWIGLADPRGRVVAASQGALQGRDVSARPWFPGALKMPYFGDPHEAVLLAKELPADPSGEPLRFVDVALAVHDKQGVTQGVLGAHLYWRWVQDVIRASLAEEARALPFQVLIAGRDGRWLVKPPEERSRSVEEGRLDADRQSLFATATSAEGSPADALGWTVYVRVSKSRALAVMYADRRLLIALTLVLSGLFSWLSWLLAGRLAAPIEHLAAEAASVRMNASRTPQFRQRGSGRETRQLASALTDLVTDLQARSAQLSLFLEHAPAALAMLDNDLRLLAVSTQWLADFQVTRTDVLGLTLSEVVPQAPPRWRARHERALAGNHEGLEEEALLMPDGTRRWLRWELRPWFKADGRIGGLMQYVDDITSDRLAQDRIAALNADLTIQVAAQTAELSLAKELAEQATRAKSAFLASMSHEIRTPMNGVLGLTHLLQRTQLDPRQLDYVNKIAGSGKHLLGIINNILDLSKIEADKLTLDVREFDLDEMLANVAQLFTQQAALKSIELVMEIAADVPTRLMGDAMRVEQILINYLSNAFKFTERGEVVLSVLKTGSEQAVLRFEVTDTGPGLTAEQMGRLFANFEQVDDEAARRAGGTGLGLAICRRLAGLMGGRVGVSSTQGNGATFWTELPLGAGSGATDARESSRRNGRLLLVEDNVRTQQAIAAMGAAVWEEVTSVATAAAALPPLQKGAAIDVALVDESVEKPDAFEFASNVVRAAPRISLFLLSIDPEREGLRERAAAAGYRDVIPKPLLRLDLSRLAGESRRLARAPMSGGSASNEPELLSGVEGARVLLAEDNPINRLVASEMLRLMGVQVDLAENGRQAVEMASSERHDLIFMDVQMPLLDGIGATREIRARAGLERLPIIAMTANAFDSDRDDCLDAGMNDFLSKPIAPEELGLKLRRWIRPQR